MPPIQPAVPFEHALSIHQSGRFAEAESLYRGILKATPKNPNAQHMLGLAVFQQGRVPEAIKILSRVVRTYPDFAEAHYNLGVVHLQAHSLNDAVRSFKAALKHDPKHERAVNNLGNALLALNRFSDAEKIFRQALDLADNNGDAWHHLGTCLQQQGKRDEAFAAHRRAVAAGRDNPIFWDAWANNTLGLTFSTVDAALLDDLRALLHVPSNSHEGLVPAVVSALSHTAAGILFSDDGAAQIADGAAGTLATTLSDIPLLLRLLETSTIAMPATERALIALRRTLLGDAALSESALPFLVALAVYCYQTDYAFAQSDAELARADEIKKRLENGAACSACEVAILATYVPLHTLGCAQALLDRPWPDAMAALIRVQLSEPNEERAIRATTPAVTPINDAISNKVRAQYEENPYPRWVVPARFPQAQPLETVLRQMPLDLEGIETFPESPDVLIAGCGTGRHALRTASQFADARILAVDLSTTSLAYAIRKTKDVDDTAIDYAQADILELASLERSFDIVESAGVLHHMEDPTAGWSVLATMVKPGGFMRIALYSELARALIVQLRDTINRDYSDSSPDGIRAFRSALLGRTDLTPDLEDLLKSRDFYSLSDCRDLLFHVQEHRFTVPQLEQATKDLGLDFLGFEVPPSVAQAFTKKNKKGHALSSLPLWHQFEQRHPETFRGMYQFWCRKPA